MMWEIYKYLNNDSVIDNISIIIFVYDNRNICNILFNILKNN